MIRFFKRRAALKEFVSRFPLDLFRRFEGKQCYTISEVNVILESYRTHAHFRSYAHALFCSEKEFQDHYALPQFVGLYRRLRQEVSKKYFTGNTGFNAMDLVRYARCLKDRDTRPGEECDLGECFS